MRVRSAPSHGSRPGESGPRPRQGVGGTPIVEAHALGAQLRIRHLWVKNEGVNPSGSMIDRLSAVHVEAALREKKETVAWAAQGPAAASLACLAKRAGLACVLHVPEDADARWATAARIHGARIVTLPGDFEACVEASRATAASEGWYDANPSPQAAERRLRAYSGIAEELLQLQNASIGVVAVPTRNGTAVAGLWQGLETLRGEERLGNVPALLAATTKMGNPIVWSLASQEEACVDLDPRHVFSSATSEPLAAHHAPDGTACMRAVRDSQGWAYAASDEELENLAQQLARTESIEVLPAATAGIAALRFATKLGRLDPDAIHLAILTDRA